MNNKLLLASDDKAMIRDAMRMKPLSRAIATLLLAGGVTGTVVAQQAFSPAWFSTKGAVQQTATSTGRLPNGLPANSLTGPQQQSDAARDKLRLSIDNLNTAAQSIAMQQRLQQQAREAALLRPSSIPDGLGSGGLKIDEDELTRGWHNAKDPTQTVADGKTTVTIEQTGDKAILNWETFNVGKNTTVDFKQNADWAVLNRINDPLSRPSEIQGQIKGAGTVLLINRNGVLFSGSSQVNVRNLVVAAANLTDAQFKERGLYNGTSATFTDAAGKVVVEAGAVIETAKPANSTTGGGYVLLLGQEVDNLGALSAAKGQVALAAGDSFVIRKGVGTDGNQASTTRGNEITAQFGTDSLSGQVSNTGLIMAREGDVTMVGRDVQQNGVALATTTVNTRGTVHLNAIGADGKVTLGQGATTAVTIEDDGKTTALDSQRDGLRAPAVTTPGDIGPVTDRRDQSRIEIGSGGTVDFQGDTLTLATGGQIVVNAASRSLVREGARIDVSGAVGVNLSMESNNVKVNIQGNEQRDAPLNRDDKGLNSNDVWIDRRSLVFVPKGTNGYDSDRWYTAGGLLEVGGYLGTQGHTVGEWMAQGGTVSFGGNEVVTQAGSNINLSGGTLNVQAGFINQTWLKGADGRLHEVSKAAADQLYTGVYKGFEDEHARWGEETTRYFHNPVIGSQKRLENGYTVGRDAGLLVVGTRSAVIEGNIVGDTFQGVRQTQAPNLHLDGYDQSQNAVARGGQLVVGSYGTLYDKSTGLLHRRLDTAGVKDVVLTDTAERIAAGLDLSTALPAARQDTLILDTTLLNGFSLGAVRIAATGSITVDAALTLGNGGDITLYGPKVGVNADLTAHGGRIRLGDTLTQASTNYLDDTTIITTPEGLRAGVAVASGVALDTHGLWSNLLLDPADTGNMAWRNGGSVSIRSSADVLLAEGSVVDVSSGAALLANGKSQQGGKGGDIRLQANAQTGGGEGVLAINGALRGRGASGGGTLSLQAGQVLVTDGSVAAAEPGTLVLSGDFFDKGFSRYELIGDRGLTVADGTQVAVTMPVLRVTPEAKGVATGADAGQALQAWTPPLYTEDAVKGVLTQRAGASLSLQAGTAQTLAADLPTVAAVIGQAAQITVDPGQAIDVRSVGQLTMNGTLNAWGGSVSLGGLGTADSEQVEAGGHGRSIWIGEQALIDVAAHAVTAVDNRGGAYGQVRNGGKIVIGGEIDPVTGIAKADDLFVVVRDGARLDASGAQAALDIPGQGRVQVASNGGSISLASNNGLYLDGSFTARAGGAGAAGGSLSVALESPYYIRTSVTDRVTQVRELVLSQVHQGSTLAGTADAAADSLEYGHGRLGVDQVSAGGFDNLAVLSNGLLSFDGDVALSMGQSLRIYGGGFGLSESAAINSRVRLSAPHLLLAGILAAPEPNRDPWLRPVLGVPTMSQRATEAVFEASGNLIDVRGNVLFGTKGVLPQVDGSTMNVERRGFDDVQLTSQGDLRFLAGASPDAIATGISTQLMTKGDLTLRAAQLYPATAVGPGCWRATWTVCPTTSTTTTGRAR